MKNKDEIARLFHDKLSGAEMEVPADFWNHLQNDLLDVGAENAVRIPFFAHFRWVAAAAISVLLGIGALSYYLHPVEEIVPTMPLLTNNRLEVDVEPSISLPVINIEEPKISPTKIAAINPPFSETEEDEMVEVTVTIHTETYGTTQRPTSGGYAQVSNGDTDFIIETNNADDVSLKLYEKHWKMAAVVGTSLPKEGYSAPMSLGVKAIKDISQKAALEAGLIFTHYPVDGASDVNTLSIPVNVDYKLAQNDKLALYVTAGAVIEKVLGSSFSEDPVLLSANAGVGVEYQLTDRLSLYAEPEVSYRFNQNGQTRYLRNEQQLGVELMGGLRMSF